jgi:phosphoribosylformylglycinamidine cyclo-ligase
VGDIGVHGADPLFFLDYVGMGKLDPAVVESVVEGLARGCRANGCALIGGETAEMPGVYAPDDFDLVGCIVGTVRRGDFVDGSAVAPGDALLGFPSTGLHTNGYSLARRILFEDAGLTPEDELPGTETTLGEALLAVHRSYLSVLKALRGTMKGAAHITGGGIPGNLSRILPSQMSARVDLGTWTAPPIFRYLAEEGGVPSEDLYPAFNMGIGLVVVVPGDQAEECLNRAGAGGRVIGEIVPGDGTVTLEGETQW